MLDQVIQELARFLNITLEEARQRVEQYNAGVAAERWRETQPDGRQGVEAFYKDTEYYLYELIPWNYASDSFNKRVSPLFFYHNKKILELGAGIGSLDIALTYAGNQVTYCDISDRLTAFANQRFQDRGFSIPQVKDLTGLHDFDMVVAIDFFEHIHPDALPGLLKEISSVLKDDGFLYHRSTWGRQETYPMHFDHSSCFNKLAKDAGLSLRENGDLVKGSQTEGVQIGIPVLGDLPDEVFYSFLEMKKPRGTRLTKVKGVSADIARNEIINKIEKDWIFFMDSDQTFHPESLMRLLSWDLPIVSGLYFKTPGKPVPHCYRFSHTDESESQAYAPLTEEVFDFVNRYQDEVTQGQPAIVLPAHKGDLLECDGVGGGCLLIHRRVFEAIEPPYFKYTDGTAGGEDFYFCRKVQEAGFKIFVDPGVICGHKQKDMVGTRHFLSWISKGEYEYPWE